MTQSNRYLNGFTLKTALVLVCAAGVATACGGDDPKPIAKTPTAGTGNTPAVTTGGTPSEQSTVGETGGTASTEPVSSGGGGTASSTGGDGATSTTGSGGSSSSSSGCISDKECTPQGMLCNTTRRACVECLTNAECTKTANSECIQGACVVYKTCKNSLDCTATNQVCEPDKKRCVDCASDNDCTDGKTCKANVCRTACTSDLTCTPKKQLCDTKASAGYCVDCVKASDCGDGKTCDAGSCVTGGSAPVNCAGNTGDPCAAIPAFTYKGTQTVDGNGDEFCNIPGKEITVATAAYKRGTDVETNTTARAVIRAGWSASALHVHIHVDDPTLLVGPNKHDGDNVQLFISNVGPATSGSQIVLVPPFKDAKGAAEERYTDYKYEYAVVAVEGGYEVEVKWPWPQTQPASGGSPVATVMKSGNTIAFDVLVGVQDKEATAGLDVEYGLSAIPAGTTGGCSGEQLYHCNPAVWCNPKLQ